MTKQFVLASCLTFFLLISLLAQTPVSPLKPPQEKTEDDVVRITSNLVQLDVTVTDKDGRQVTDLKPEDFEIREEGRPQPITNFSYIQVSPEISVRQPSGKVSESAPRTPPPPTLSRIRPDQVQRTMGIVVDDDTMSFGSLHHVRETLQKFVADQIEPGDLVGVFRSTGGNRLLQQFTMDQNQLALAVRKLIWYPSANNTVDVFEPARREVEQEREELPGRLTADDLKSPIFARAEYFHNRPDDPKVISALRFLISDMRKLPGRKSIILFSDRLPIRKQPDPLRVAWLLRLVTDYANRSGVVIYVVDARGLVNTDVITAQDDIVYQTSPLREGRARDFYEEQNGLNYLAEKTGGTFAKGNNDLARGIRSALEERRGYYLIGYRPSEDTFKNGVRGFRKLEVKLKRPGLRVRTREGFVGITDDALEVPKRPATENSPIYQVLASPLAATDIPVRLTPVFGQDATGTSFLRALLHINAEALKFVDQPNGMKRLTLDVAAVTFAQDGRVVDEFTRTHTIQIPPEGMAFIRQNGLVYSADTPVKTPGAYQFRIAVRDASSSKFGSATQFIEIADLKKGLLSLSSIVLTQADSGSRQGLPPAAPAEAALSLIQSGANPAVRRFRPGMVLSYGYLIYNSQSGKRKPQITTQVRLFQDGREVFAGPELPFDPGRQTDLARLSADGMLPLGPTLTAGDYVLQITVKDQADGKKPRVAIQWIDFEIVK